MLLSEATMPQERLCNPQRQEAVLNPESIRQYRLDRLSDDEIESRARKPVQPLHHQDFGELRSMLLVQCQLAPAPCLLAPPVQ